MRNRQLFALFVCSFVPLMVGNGLVPLLPLYASEFGVSPVVVGLYMASSYLALAGGTIAGGWLADRFQRRKWQLVLLTAFGTSLMGLMGQVTQFWQLVVLTTVIWGCSSAGSATINILAGMSARPEERGRVFGILAMTPALGALVGGALFGSVVDAWGYGVLFMVLAVIGAAQPLVGLLLTEPPPAERSVVSSAAQSVSLGRPFYLLLVTSVAAGVALFVGRMGTSLAMHSLDFSAAAISSTMAAGGAVTLPLAVALGKLSDRMSRSLLLGFCYSGAAVGLLTLALATALWQFWLAAALLSLSSYVGGGVGSALVTDLVPKAALGRGISQFQTTVWVGGIIGYAVAGVAIESVGAMGTFLGVGLLLLLSITLLIPRAMAAPAAISEP